MYCSEFADSCGDEFQRLLDSLESSFCSTALTTLKRVNRNSRRPIDVIAAEYWDSGKTFNVLEYADIVSAQLAASSITYDQCRFALFCYEIYIILCIAQQFEADKPDPVEIKRALESLIASCSCTDLRFLERVLRMDCLPESSFLEYMRYDENTKDVFRCTRFRLTQAHGYPELPACKSEHAHIRCISFRDIERSMRDQQGVGYAWLPSVLHYSASLLVSALFVAVGVGWPIDSLALLAAFIAVFAVLHFAEPAIESVTGGFLKPRQLLRYDFLESGVPDDARVVIAVPTLIHSTAQIDDLVNNSDWNIRTAADTNVSLAILSDFPDSASQAMTAEQNVMLSYLVGAIDTLRASGFRVCLLHRERMQLYDGEWIGWERKRGKLIQLNRLALGQNSGLICLSGAVEDVLGVRYALCLDEDSRISRDCVQRLAGVLHHPSNAPEVRNGWVIKGYGLAAPRFLIRSQFLSRWRTPSAYFGPTGSEKDPPELQSNFTFDSTGNAQYPGKGMYSIPLFEAVMDSVAIEDATLLSHDTIEGTLLRTAYVGDCVISEGFATKRTSLLIQLHRWIRGDIQNLLIFCFRCRSGSKRIIPGFFIHLLVTQLRLAFFPILLATALSLVCFWPSPATLGAVAVIALAMLGFPALHAARRICTSALPATARLRWAATSGLSLCSATVLHVLGAWTTSWVTLDATVRAIFRSYTGRHLIEWRSSSITQSDSTGPLRVPGVLPATVSAAAVLAANINYATSLYGMALFASWLAYPFVIDRISTYTPWRQGEK